MNESIRVRSSIIRRDQRRWSATSLVAVSLLLTGCAEPIPQVSAEPVAVVPALTGDQDTRILDSVNAVLAASDAARDPAQLGERVTGPALLVRTSQLEVAALRNDDELVTELPTSYQQIIVPTTDTWPRTMYAITEAGEGLAPPRLLALQQAEPREPYKLWGWVQLRPGVSMPAFADPRIGTAELAPDDASLKFTPEEVARQYADLLTNGDASPYVGNFEPAQDDPYRAFLATWIAAQQQALEGERVNGTYTFSAAPLPDTEVKAIRTVTLDGVDDGALVLFALQADERLEAMEGAILTPQTKTAQALLEGETFSNVLTATYTDMIALYVPMAGSTEPIILLGNSHVQTAAGVATEHTEEAAEDASSEDAASDDASAEDSSDDAATTEEDGEAASN